MLLHTRFIRMFVITQIIKTIRYNYTNEWIKNLIVEKFVQTIYH